MANIMRRFLAILMVAMMGGCATARANKAVRISMAVAGGGTLTVGLVELAFGFLTIPADNCSSCDDGPELRRNGIILSLSGLALLTGFVIVERQAERARRDQQLAHRQEVARIELERAERARLEHEREARERIEHITRREQAFDLVKTARQAAHSGDCGSVLELQPKVRELDAHVHDAWFLGDDAIKTCLGASTTGSAAPSTEPQPSP